MSVKCDCLKDDGKPCQNEATRECEDCNLDKVKCEQHIRTCMVCGAEVAACCSEPCNYNDWHYDLCVPCAKHDKDHEVLLEMFPEDEELREILWVDEEGEESRSAMGLFRRRQGEYPGFRRVCVKAEGMRFLK